MSVLELFTVEGQVAIVTGAGRGIGAATAVALAEAGADVVISARTAEQLDEVAAAIRATGRRAAVIPADLNDTGKLDALVAAARDELGRLDIVVNNVGGAMPTPLLDTSDKLLEDAFHFNVTTAHALTSAAVPLMLGGGGGSVVNIASVMGRLAGRGFLAYGTAKAALTHYTRLAATDLAPRIRVNAIDVGSVHTSALDVVARDEKIRTSMEQATPLRRLGHPDEVAAAVLFLASRASGYTTGSVLRVDGGIGAPNLDFNLPDL
jgi:7-alpha-hydroxysteroid dehydrogenase